MSDASHFQVKLNGTWKNYDVEQDSILKCAFLAGEPTAIYSLREHRYECDFKKMVQKNVQTGTMREIRPPHKWKPPKGPVSKPGPTTCVTVPPGAPGTTIQVPHPHSKTATITVTVPPTARVGQVMLVPLPELPPDAVSDDHKISPTAETATSETAASPETGSGTSAAPKTGEGSAKPAAATVATSGVESAAPVATGSKRVHDEYVIDLF